MFLVLLLLSACAGSLQAEEQSLRDQHVRYKGPVVYSNLPPPVLYFPTVPHQDLSLRSNDFQSSVHQAAIAKNAIEYVPFPYQDLPVLVYQSKENPPIHVINNLQDSEKSTLGYHKDSSGKEVSPSFATVNTATTSNEQKVAGTDYYPQSIGPNTGVGYQHVLIQLPQEAQNAYGPRKDDDMKTYNSIPNYSSQFSENPQSTPYYKTPYSSKELKSQDEKQSQLSYQMDQTGATFLQPSDGYQTLAVIDYSQFLSPNHDRDSTDGTTGTFQDSSPERTGYFWRQSIRPFLRQYLQNTNPLNESPLSASSDQGYYNSALPSNPLGSFYDVSARFINTLKENQNHKQDSLHTVSALELQPLYLPSSQISVQENVMQNYPMSAADSSNLYQAAPSSVQKLFVQVPQESNKSNRETKNVDVASFSPQSAYNHHGGHNYLHSINTAQDALNNDRNSDRSSYQMISSQSALKYSEANADASALPHLVYTGHPPIHVFQHPIVIKVSSKGNENHLRNTQNNYDIKHSATGNLHKIPIGSIGNFGAFKPTFEKGNIHLNNHLDQTSSADSVPENDFTDGAKHPGNLAEIFRQQAESFIGGQTDGANAQGHVQAITLPFGIDSIAIYGGRISPFSPINRGYYNRYFIRNKNPASGQPTNAGMFASRIFDRLAAFGNTFFVNNLGLKPFSYQKITSPQSHTAVTEILHAQPKQKLENSHRVSSSGERDAVVNSKLSERMSGLVSGEAGRTADSTPKVQYRVPSTKTTASPQHHKPPIIIYKGIQPPVHVYGESVEENNKDSGSQRRSYETVDNSANSQLSSKSYEMTNSQQTSVPMRTSQGGPSAPHPIQAPYISEPYAASMPQTFSVPYDNSASTFSNRASVDHEDFDHTAQVYRPALDFPKEKSDASWMPINFPHYTEAESIGDLILPPDSSKHTDTTSGLEEQPNQPDTAEAPQPRADETETTEENTE